MDSPFRGLGGLCILTPAVGRIVQAGSLPGNMAGALARYLEIGEFDWLEQRFDTTFATEDTTGHGRFAPQNGELPGIANAGQENSHFALYPNPTSGNFIAESSGGTLSLMSIDGRVLQEYKLAKGKVKLELPAALAAGVYMIKYKGAEKDRILRLVYQP